MTNVEARTTAARIGIIVSTYNSPAALTSCLASLCVQTRMPDGVYVADDGSSPETRAVVRSFDGRLPIHHVWHEDRGFRLAAIRNRALSVMTESYVVTLDGDTVAHRRFVEDHGRYARVGRVVLGGRCGVMRIRDESCFRAPTGLALLGMFLRGQVINDSRAFTLSSSNSCRGLLKGMRLPQGLYRRASVRDAHGGNMAMWRRDMLAVNGYDERFVGWGGEDHDILDRITRLGVEPWQLLGHAVCYHLDHPVNARNEANIERVRETRSVYCQVGVDQYVQADDLGRRSRDGECEATGV